MCIRYKTQLDQDLDFIIMGPQMAFIPKKKFWVWGTQSELATNILLTCPWCKELYNTHFVDDPVQPQVSTLQLTHPQGRE